jgi:hypothetical protein
LTNASACARPLQPDPVAGEPGELAEEADQVDVVLAGTERQRRVGPVDAELVAAERLVGAPVGLDPVPDPDGAGPETAGTRAAGERRQRDAGPGHVAHRGAREAELGADVRGAVGADEAVRLRRTVVERVRADVVGLAKAPVAVLRVVRLGVEQGVTELHRPGLPTVGEVRQDRQPVVVREGGAEQARLVGVALRETDGAERRVTVGRRVEECVRPAFRSRRLRTSRPRRRLGGDATGSQQECGADPGANDAAPAQSLGEIALALVRSTHVAIPSLIGGAS